MMSDSIFKIIIYTEYVKVLLFSFIVIVLFLLCLYPICILNEPEFFDFTIILILSLYIIANLQSP